MSKYTTEVRFICENYAGLEESDGYDSVNEIISNSREKVFDFEYPIFDEAYRPVLETKILKHYYTREISAETVGLWKLWLDAKMNEIMPYYNKLYNTELLEFNPLYDVDYRKEGTKEDQEDNTRTNNLLKTSTDSGRETSVTGVEEGGSDERTNVQTNGGRDSFTDTKTDSGTDRKVGVSTDSGTEGRQGTRADKYSEWNLYSDTPQGGIEGIQGAENEPSLVDDGYLTNARHIIHDGTGTTEGSTTTFGKVVNTQDTTTYGKTETENGSTTYGKTVNTNDTTEYGKTLDKSETTNFGKINNTADTGTVKFNGTTEGEYAEHVYGKYPGSSYSKLIQEFRDTLINIDMMIIKELRPLFFNLW